MLKIREGFSVQISGAELPGGRIDLRYTSDGKVAVAADAGDYIYPADVRFDRASERLYIKASGLAVLSGPQTWLYEYDLNKRKQTKRARVDPSVLQPECAVSNSN